MTDKYRNLTPEECVKARRASIRKFFFLYFGISYYRSLDPKKTDYSN